MRLRFAAAAAALLIGSVVACSGDADGDAADAAPDPADAGVAPGFPADYAATYAEVRDCRRSGDHGLNFIRVLVDPAALGPYQDRATPFPEGAVVLKEEYDVADTDCSGEIVQWTAMIKRAAETDQLGWTWQRVDDLRALLEVDTPSCYGCHAGCTDVGYDGTCAEP